MEGVSPASKPKPLGSEKPTTLPGEAGTGWDWERTGKNGVWDHSGMPSLIRIPLTLKRKDGSVKGFGDPSLESP